jgi:hypothetical protein
MDKPKYRPKCRPIKIVTKFAGDYVDHEKLEELLEELFSTERYSLQWREDNWIVQAETRLTSIQINSVRV